MTEIKNTIAHTVNELLAHKNLLKDNTLSYLEERRAYKQSYLFSSKCYEYSTQYGEHQITFRIFRGGYHKGHSIVFKNKDGQEDFTILFKDDGDLKISQKAISLENASEIYQKTPLIDICHHVMNELKKSSGEFFNIPEDWLLNISKEKVRHIS